MTIRNYTRGDAAEVLRLWNTAGAQTMGYAPQSAEGLDALLLRHPDFSEKHSFVLTDADGVTRPRQRRHRGRDAQGRVRGYFSCLLLDPAADSDENTALLLAALEDSFRAAGKSVAAVTCFNPVRLPWIIPSTDGHQHNNMPGIPTDTALYRRMLALGWVEATTEQAMHLDLSGFQYPEKMREKERKMAENGYFVDWYREGVHQGVDEMVESLNNSMWSEEIPPAAHNGMRLLVGLEGNTVAGFTGPVYPEPTDAATSPASPSAPASRTTGLVRCCFISCARPRRTAARGTCRCSRG